jgi:hypothetical protein
MMNNIPEHQAMHGVEYGIIIIDKTHRGVGKFLKKTIES